MPEKFRLEQAARTERSEKSSKGDSSFSGVAKSKDRPERAKYPFSIHDATRFLLLRGVSNRFGKAGPLKGPAFSCVSFSNKQTFFVRCDITAEEGKLTKPWIASNAIGTRHAHMHHRWIYACRVRFSLHTLLFNWCNKRKESSKTNDMEKFSKAFPLPLVNSGSYWSL